MTKKHQVPNFKPRSPGFKETKSGDISRVGPVQTKTPPARPPADEGVRRSLYWRK